MESSIQRAAWAAVVAAALVCQVAVEGGDQKVFLREFTLIRRDHLPEDTAEGPGGHKPDDSNSRTARSEEDHDTLWDAWGPWSECSRTCGGGASYSLRRCLSSRMCEGQNIKYRTCSNVDCPPGAGNFRAQQCSAHADVRHQGRYHDWLPLDNDPENPCALKCRARGSDLVVELAPKVLDGTRCYTESLDMCINGACQIVGCDHELGSTAKEDNCGVCHGDGSTCRLVRGHYKSQQSAGKSEDTVVVIPFGTRHVRLVLKGPDHLYLESKTLQGVKGENSLSGSGQYHLENTTIDFQKFPDKEVLRITGPMGADFTVKIRHTGSADSVVQYIFYQPIIHRWRETDFFPCSVTCGGGYQLTSAECYDLRSGRVVVDQYCHYYPENVKPKPKLQECNMDPCPASDGYKQIMPYDLYHPLPRWESSPWTTCSTSCGGGAQTRSVSCVEEDMQGTVTPAEEWKCLYAPKTPILQPCNTFDCPIWLAQEWSPCTVTCGQGLRYRVVLCVDYRGLHAGGCNAKTKPHIKEECLVPVPCFKPAEKLPVEAKPPWFKQAQELDEETAVSEEPTFIPGPWSPCSRTCGAGTQHRVVRCQVLLSFAQTVADLPDDECEGPKPLSTQPCYRRPCRDLGIRAPAGEEHQDQTEDREENTGLSDGEELYDWEYEGFTECSESCGRGVQEAVVICRNKQTREPSEESLCVSVRRPPQLLRACNTGPCPPRWEKGAWSSCSATCGVGLQTRSVSCVYPRNDSSNQTITAIDKECRVPKPTLVQACNRFDCPPMWKQQEWGLCSHSCGNGTQRRGVLCKQRLADGSVLELPDTFCPSLSPVTVQLCDWKPCPPRWIPTEWSQCSVTCGEGIQSLAWVCQQQDEGGEHQTLPPSACSSPPPLVTSRLCFLGPCTKMFRPSSTKQGPSILAQRKVYIQWRKEKKLQFVTGGFAYLLPRTSVIIRCPTRRFRKGHVGWLKDGKPLTNTAHPVITPLGHVKIQSLGSADSGLYSCLAGQVREDFVLKLIGSKRKLAVEDRGLWKTQTNGKVHFESASLQDWWQSLSRYDLIVQRLLDLKDLAQDGPDSRELRESAERNGSTLEDEDVMDKTLAMLVVDMWRLDEVLRNLSLWPGELGGSRGDQILVRLLEELVQHHGDSNESTHLHPEGSEPPVQVDTHMATPDSGIHTSRPGISTASAKQSPQPPIIIQKNQKLSHKSSSEVVAHVGVSLLLPQMTTSVELRCETLGIPEPVVIWSKDGKVLHYSNRVALLPGAALRIRAPSEADEGLYTCTARNHAGSASLSSLLRMAGPLQAVNDTAGTKGACSGQDCPHRWVSSPWSTCSVSCGGGVQSRRVSCQPGTQADGVGATELDPCARAGRRPPDTQPCNTQPCASWATSNWSHCRTPCVGPHLATQHRQVFCESRTGTKLHKAECRALPRPSSHRNCSTEACKPHWWAGPWTQCTATCGNHGFQSRRVTCVWPHGPSGVTHQPHCTSRGRPAGWRRCNIQPCSRAGECRDSTRYCKKVQELELCSLPQFKTRCCKSCQDT